MVRERFDLVFSLGSGCGCSRILRERGLQFASFPLDWVGGLGVPGTGAGLRKAADLVASGYAGWFEEANLVHVPEEDSPKFDGYKDVGTGLFFSHDFSKGGDLHAEYPAAREKYVRRIARFLGLLTRARKVLAVWIADPRDAGIVGEEDARHALATLSASFPQTEFRLLTASCAQDVPLECDRVVRGEGYELHAFDYRVVKTGRSTWDLRTEQLAPFLDSCECVDYRTRTEKRANRRREKVRAYEKYKAKNAWIFFVNRLQFKLYRHLKRILDRKGILKGLE